MGLPVEDLPYHILNRPPKQKFPTRFIPLEGLLPVDIPTRDNASLNEQRTVDQSEIKNTYPLLSPISC